ncbi:MAG TPA: tetraacyldisaccharide 4'-kinase [Rhabdochlamydiaceae bacterium]|nr:tetraacyldisaccharide 4'-kinase [Rhabdochlamydiaceae bacterium]
MLESYVLDIMEGRRKGRSLLRALSYLYRTGVALRNEAYDVGVLKAHDAGLPVVSVGNIIAGGTGKTPFVKFLAEELLKKFQVAILSRGYRSDAEMTGAVLQVTPQTDVASCGDEPFWLAHYLPKAQVWVGKNRIESARRAKENGADIVLMDDGMQHRQLKRDIEIVLVDGEDPFGKGFFLPRGLLRDSPERLKKADCIVVIQPISEQIESQLRQFTDAPIILAQRKTDVSLKGKKVAVFCAIGKPQKFLQAVRDAGGEIVASFFKPDHDPFYPEELNKFAEESSADILVCTEKDQVKLKFQCSLPIIPLTSRLEISESNADWQELLNKIQSRVKP